MKVLALCVILGTLLGCGKPGYGMEYTVLLDRNLTAAQDEAVITAGYRWETAVPGLALHPVVASCGGFEALPEHAICVRADDSTPRENGDHVDGHTSYDGDVLRFMDRADVLIHPTNFMGTLEELPDVMLNVVTHELGHALAHRGDHIQDGNLMAPVASTSPETITANDVAYFWSKR